MTTENTTIDPLEMARFNAHADKWWDLEGPLKTLHDINPARLNWIQKYVDVSNRSVLDVGCGGGVLSEGLAKAGAKVTGLDAEPGAIETARAHAAAQQLDIQYVCEPIEQFKTTPFDVVTCLEMLEHVANPVAIIAAAAARLKPGGYLFLSTLNRTPKAYALAIVAAEYILSLLPRETHDFERFIRPSELAQAVRDTGLEVVGTTGLVYHPFTRKAVLQAAQLDVNYLMVAKKPSDAEV